MIYKRSIAIVMLILLAQVITGFLIFKYLSMAMGWFSLGLIIFIQGIQVVLEYYIFSRIMGSIAKVLAGLVILSIMVMNVNYLQISRGEFDKDYDSVVVDKEYLKRVESYEGTLQNYNQRREDYIKEVVRLRGEFEKNKTIKMENYELAKESYNSEIDLLQKQIDTTNDNIADFQRKLTWRNQDYDVLRGRISDLVGHRTLLQKSYSGIEVPKSPQFEILQVEKFIEEEIEIPVKSKIEIKTDFRLEFLYWLIAGILELGSLMLLYLLNKILNEKVESKKHLGTSESESVVHVYLDKIKQKDVPIKHTKNSSSFELKSREGEEDVEKGLIQKLSVMGIEEKQILFEKLNQKTTAGLNYKVFDIWVKKNSIPNRKIPYLSGILDNNKKEVSVV